MFKDLALKAINLGKKGASISGQAIGNSSSLLFSKPMLPLIGVGSLAAGFGREAVDTIENTNIEDQGTLRSVRKASGTLTNSMAIGAAGGLLGGALGKSKMGAAVGMGLGVLGGVTTGMSMPVTSGLLFGGASLLATKGRGLSGRATAGIATAASMMGIGLSTHSGMSDLNFAFNMKAQDKTVDFQGPEMAQSMTGKVNGPMIFGGGSSRSYSLGASGDLALALHHKRHG